jgi:DUF1707 SHOCT-like domain
VAEQHPDLLIGDAERSAAVADLRGHYDAGRLTLEEFEARLAEAHAARTESDLRHVFRQLPDSKLPTLSPRDRRWRSLLAQYVFLNVIANLVWLFGGANGDWWPRWMLLATLIMFARRVLRPRRAAVRRPLPPGSSKRA